jgi:hypothetical protein
LINLHNDDSHNWKSFMILDRIYFENNKSFRK